MSCLITNLPSQEVWVRKEYLTDHQSGHGEFVKGVWVSAKSIPGRAFYFETYLPEYAAMYDKLPISAFLSRPELPDPDMNLPNLQFWNCMDYGVTVVQKQFVGSMHYEVYTRDYGTQTGTYICTIDNYHQELNSYDISHALMLAYYLIFRTSTSFESIRERGTVCAARYGDLTV